MRHSKYSESNETKISLGPVFAINPRYVTKIEIIGGVPDNWWMEVLLVNGERITTELEPPEAIEQLARDMVAANPKIEVDRYPKDLRKTA